MTTEKILCDKHLNIKLMFDTNNVPISPAGLSPPKLEI